jgi:hypothetical protein
MGFLKIFGTVAEIARLAFGWLHRKSLERIGRDRAELDNRREDERRRKKRDAKDANNASLDRDAIRERLRSKPDGK